MPDPRDEFYVGYLPAPNAHLRVVRLLVTILGVWILLLGVVMAFAMRQPGEAEWSTQEQVWVGTLIDQPYPMLIPEDDSPAHLVVEMGKAGAHERVRSVIGRRVELTGFLLQRDGRRIIELTPGERAIRVLDGVPTRPPEPSAGMRVQLAGEIVDGKCYLGAMKPGDGLTHKSCATLCIRGGLPPMFLSQTPDGPAFRLLLVDGRSALPVELLALVAEPVRIEGELVEIAGVPAVSVAASDITLQP